VRPVRGKWFVVVFVPVVAAIAVTFITIKLSGRGAGKRNFLILSYTAGLRDLDEGFYVSAIENLTPIVEANSEPAAAGFRGESYLRLKKYAEAEKDFRTAIEREPGLPANHAGLGAALAGQGRHADALPHYDEALRLFDAAPPLGRVRRTGDTAEEVERLRAASAGAKR